MNRFFVLLFLPLTASAVTLKWRAETNSRLYLHTRSPIDLASHRHSLELDSSLREGAFWSLHAGGKTYVEGAFAGNESRYGADIRRRESSDFRLKDAYLQYKSGGWTVKAGNQQVVWGEAFGFYYADFLNPKDLRQLGIGPLEKNQVSIPMFNVKYIHSDYSFQAVAIPKPYFHLMPAQGGDFSFPFESFFPGTTLTHLERSSLDLKTENVEVAARLTARLGAWDLALLGGYYFDRQPVYESAYTSVSSVTVGDRHDRLKTIGFTSSVSCGPFVCRSEILCHVQRYYNTFQFPNFSPEVSDEFVGVLGIDYTESDRTYFGLQISENYRNKESSAALTPRSQQNVSLHARLTTWWNQKLESILTYLPHDKSMLIQAQYLVPLSQNVEFLLLGDTFLGEDNSQFGQYKRASRVGTMLKIYLTND